MKKHLLISILALTLGLCYSGSLMAEANANRRNPRQHAQTQHGWRKTPDRHGLYFARHKPIAQGIAITGNVLYYYGDIDMPGVAFKGGFQKQSVGGSAVFSYLHPLANSANWRFSLSGGYLHGNDSARYNMVKDPITENETQKWIGKGEFKNGFGELAAGIEWYPFPKSGFYLYAGLGLNVSVINYDFTQSGRDDGKKVSVLPMIPLEIGYTIDITHGFFMTIMASVHQGLLDVPEIWTHGRSVNPVPTTNGQMVISC